jgi:hypothetical protein
VTRELHVGEEVLGADGRVLGTVDRLVVDESAHRVTHVVVSGHLLGVRRLKDTPDGLTANVSRDQFEKLPAAQHDHLGAPGDHWTAPLGYRLENFLALAGAVIGQGPYVPPVHLEPDLEDVHEITQGSPVWSGNRRIGEVERVFTGAEGRVTELVVRHAGLLGKRLRLPIDRVLEVVGNNVHTDLTEQDEESLPEYS